MTQAIMPKLFKNIHATIDDLSEQILQQPIAPLVQMVDLNVSAIKESDNLMMAVKLISNAQQGVLLMIGRGKGCRGLITRSDCIRGVANDQLEERVNQLCTKRNEIVEIDLDDTVASALQRFSEHKIRRLLVFDKDDQMKVGVLNRPVLMNWLMERLLR